MAKAQVNFDSLGGGGDHSKFVYGNTISHIECGFVPKRIIVAVNDTYRTIWGYDSEEAQPFYQWYNGVKSSASSASYGIVNFDGTGTSFDLVTSVMTADSICLYAE